jgi:hypothetical protein
VCSLCAARTCMLRECLSILSIICRRISDCRPVASARLPCQVHLHQGPTISAGSKTRGLTAISTVSYARQCGGPYLWQRQEQVLWFAARTRQCLWPTGSETFGRESEAHNHSCHGDFGAMFRSGRNSGRCLFLFCPAASVRYLPAWCNRGSLVGVTSLFGGRGGIGNTIIGLPMLGLVNNSLDHTQTDRFQKILIYGLILLAALVINGYVRKLRNKCCQRTLARTFMEPAGPHSPCGQGGPSTSMRNGTDAGLAPRQDTRLWDWPDCCCLCAA